MAKTRFCAVTTKGRGSCAAVHLRRCRACYSLSKMLRRGELLMTNARLMLTTVGLKEEAEKLAQQLVERRLAACVNILGPIRSIYRWKHKVNNEQEYMLLIKNTA